MMDAVFQEIVLIYMSLNWFISMSTLNFLHPIMPFAIILPIILGGLPFLFVHDFSRPKEIKHLNIKIKIAMMPAFWVLIGLIGAIFRNGGPIYKWSGFSDYILLFIFGASFIFGIYAIFKNKGCRLITFIFFIINSYMTLFMAFIAGMSISGTWL